MSHAFLDIDLFDGQMDECLVCITESKLLMPITPQFMCSQIYNREMARRSPLAKITSSLLGTPSLCYKFKLRLHSTTLHSNHCCIRLSPRNGHGPSHYKPHGRSNRICVQLHPLLNNSCIPVYRQTKGLLLRLGLDFVWHASQEVEKFVERWKL